MVPNGSNVTGPGAVVIRAVIEGSDANGLGGAGVLIQLIDVLMWVADGGVALTGATTGGQDDEDDTTYLNRLVAHLQRLSQRPILPNDFASMALDADPSVWRAVAIDDITQRTAPTTIERMVAVAAVDVNGAAVSPTVKANVDAYLQANREINFIVNVIDPKFTTINVATTVVALAGFTQAAVQSSVVASIQQYLSPATWGQDPTITQSSGSQSVD